MQKRSAWIALLSFAALFVFTGCTNENQQTKQAEIARTVQESYEKTFKDLQLGEAHFYTVSIPNGAEKWVHFGIDTYIDGQLQDEIQELSTGNFIEREDDKYELGLCFLNYGDKMLTQLRVDGASTSLFELSRTHVEEGKSLATSWVEALSEEEEIPLVEGQKQILGAYIMNSNQQIHSYDLSDSKQLQQAIVDNYITHVLYLTVEPADTML